ncbi:glycoside hydrolase [Pseudonocardiaceae bacterium YIM PH 21723]|nr:glycoside hydrolase [Pseudonocardiaceae bacterium YIM PH 21723]
MWSARAAVAERAVRSRHMRSVWGVPFTALGMSTWPASLGQRLHRSFNYWWQAHLLDCLVDAELRAPQLGRRATIGAVVRGIRMRNLRWTNRYYDDMAWLGLALQRAGKVTRSPQRRGIEVLAEQLRQAWTPDGGGGIWWRRKDNFKNVPATGPAAILLARLAAEGHEWSDVDLAKSLVDWMDEYLVDPETGLLWDGLRVGADGAITSVEKATYTYCQGVYIGACAELSTITDEPIWAERASRTIQAVADHLMVNGALRSHGGGDGGLFAGILARYLALAAVELGDDTARKLVIDSAEAAWTNRVITTSGPLFSAEWTEPATLPRPADTYSLSKGSGHDSEVPEADLSVQLSAWMLLEAAALVERTP